MASRAQTFLTKYAAPVAEDLVLKTGSFKVIISAGVIALSKLSAEEREKTIAEANGVIFEKGAEKTHQVKSKPKTLREALKNIIKASTEDSEIPAMIIEIRPADKPLWNTLRQLLESEPEQQKKRKRG